ncbi:transmembrane protein 126A-like [Alligator sinensis]|uniref:Transmembrane protein 126A-like n=1 Tax=Alligator sinensis TaxID=38654 RepID=A0A1U7SG04_ALLSI|nr:transmembrane protein 126A-like [Alligator sinensis]
MQSLTMTPTESPKLNSPTQNLTNPKRKVLEEMFRQLPADDQKYMKYASVFLGLNATLYGLAANNSFRRLLNISQAGITSTLSMTFFPLITTTIGYNWLLVQPLLTGNLNCSSDAVVRGGLIGSVVSAMYPIALAVSLNKSIAARTTPLTGKQKTWRYWFAPSGPVFKKMSLAMVLQGMTGAYLGFTHHRTYEKMLQICELNKDLKD